MANAWFEQSPFSTVVYDVNGRIVALNDAFRRLWGVGIEAAPPDYSIFTDPELDRVGVRPLIAAAFAGAEVALPPLRYDIAKVSTTGQGRVVWTEARLFPIRDASGAVAQVVLMHLDVTKQVEAENALADRESRARNLLSLTTALSEAVTFDEVADAVFREGLRAAGADAGSLALVHESGDQLSLGIVRSAGYSEAIAQEYQTMVATTGRPLSDAVLTLQPVLVGSPEAWEAQYPGYFARRMEETGYHAFAAAPVIVRGRPIAGISFSFRGWRHFDDASRALLQTIARLCAQALDRARAFDAERRERERNQMVLGAIADAFVAVDASYRYTFVNERAAAMLARRPEELLGRVVWEVLPESVSTPLSKLFRAVMDDRQSRSLEDYSLVMRRWIEMRVYPSADGGVVAFFQDISQRRRAHDASQFLAEASGLLSSSLDYGTTMQNLAAAAVPRLADFCAIEMIEDPAATEWPPRIRRIALAHENPERVRWADEFQLRLPTDWDSPHGLARVLRDRVSEYVPTITDEMLRAAAKSDEHLALLREIRLTSVIIVPLVARGRTLGALTLLMAESQRHYLPEDLAVAEDLAQRAANAIDNATLYRQAVEARAASERAAERTHRLQALTAGLARALTEQDVVDVIVDEGILAAGAAAGLVMLLSHDRTRAPVASSIGYSDDAIAHISALPTDAPYPTRDIVSTGEPIFLASTGEWRARYATPIWSDSPSQAAAFLPLVGSRRLFGVVAIRYSDEHSFDQDERAFMLAMARQCGQALERANLYDAERVARADAELANRAKMDFLATMSHELRTPLNAIGGYADLLMSGVRGPVAPEQQSDIARIQTSQRHLLSLINDVLNFAKLEAGKVELTIQPVELRPMLDALDGLLGPQLLAKHLSLEIVHCTEEGIRVRADEDKLRQILLNLLSNAMKFTADGGRIAVVCAHDATHVRIAIRDTGIGIGDQDLERIFDPFVQLERRLTNVIPGTGLGLAISRDLARAMGGDVTVESTLGAGSTFTVQLERPTS